MAILMNQIMSRERLKDQALALREVIRNMNEAVGGNDHLASVRASSIYPRDPSADPDIIRFADARAERTNPSNAFKARNEGQLNTMYGRHTAALGQVEEIDASRFDFDQHFVCPWPEVGACLNDERLGTAELGQDDLAHFNSPYRSALERRGRFVHGRGCASVISSFTYGPPPKPGKKYGNSKVCAARSRNVVGPV
jgi:hypothetical protein